MEPSLWIEHIRCSSTPVRGLKLTLLEPSANLSLTRVPTINVQFLPSEGQHGDRGARPLSRRPPPAGPGRAASADTRPCHCDGSIVLKLKQSAGKAEPLAPLYGAAHPRAPPAPGGHVGHSGKQATIYAQESIFQKVRRLHVEKRVVRTYVTTFRKTNTRGRTCVHTRETRRRDDVSLESVQWPWAWHRGDRHDVPGRKQRRESSRRGTWGVHKLAHGQGSRGGPGG